MTVLVDTNILLRLIQLSHPMHQPANDATEALALGGETLCLAPQSLYESWVVCTRPISTNGLGLPVVDAEAELAKLKRLFRVRDDTALILPTWEGLVVKYQVTGKNAHDARLVAAMIVHAIPRILTFNSADFQRYQEIAAISPADVLSAVAKGGNP